MEIDQETKSRISDTVEGILLTADMDQATEFQVRTMAAERLGIDLSNLDHRRLVRQVLESFLLSMDISADEQAVADPSVREETREVVREEQEAKPEELDSDGDVICKLSNKRSVVIRDFKGRKMVWIGEYHEKDGKHVPSPKGISLTAEQWLAFRKSVPAIEAAIMKIETRTRGNQNDDMPNSLIDSTSLGLVRIKTTRLDVKNYQCWAQQMESFLNQLKIAYVLTDSCPSSNLSPGASNEEIAQAKAPVQRWLMETRFSSKFKNLIRLLIRLSLLECPLRRIFMLASSSPSSPHLGRIVV
ncbi:RNA polymerase II transcriptional coactivator KELP isoform X3 [Malania oleifera]|uniref:RNA polymerase II transcriptional coactivator KELP isoform X3 n=1 Tax=Malania oleifera TaxID=397392 RepID=UPI0025AE8B04|nr:RNA polymerase II transcriptional coactivator KELP isoform X3 [Malania oleifera]